MILDRDELLGLREELRSSDASRREGAARRLLSLVETSAPALLIEALASDSAEVRDQALLLLERMAESGDVALRQVVAAVRGEGPGA